MFYYYSIIHSIDILFEWNVGLHNQRHGTIEENKEKQSPVKQSSDNVF